LEAAIPEASGVCDVQILVTSFIATGPGTQAGVAKPERQLVVDESAAAIGKDGWAGGEASPLLAALGEETSDAVPVRGDRAKDHRLAGCDGVDGGRGCSNNQTIGQ
jgi:hypothetical protein